MTDPTTNEPTVDQCIAAAETDLFAAETYSERNAAHQALSDLNAQKLAAAFAARDAEAAASLTRGWVDGSPAGIPFGVL